MLQTETKPEQSTKTAATAATKLTAVPPKKKLPRHPACEFKKQCHVIYWKFSYSVGVS